MVKTSKKQKWLNQTIRTLYIFPSSKNNWTPPVLTCSSLENRGIDKVFEMINSFETHNIENGWLQKNRQKQRFSGLKKN